MIKFKILPFLLLLVRSIETFATIQVDVDNDYSYRVVNENKKVLFHGGDIAVFINQTWCVASPSFMSNKVDYQRMTLKANTTFVGNIPGLGQFQGIKLGFKCLGFPVQAIFINFMSGKAVIFHLKLSEGAPNTYIQANPDTSITNFPTLFDVSSHDYLSWTGSFVQSTREFSRGPNGGPTVFYNSSDSGLSTVIVGSPLNKPFKAFTAGSNQDWRGRGPAWAPGTSARIEYLPTNYSQTYILYEGSGITSTLHKWGGVMQRQASSTKKLEDVTLSKIGYQTDNGAAYCFCRERNCSKILIDEMKSLRESGVPPGYLSFQGAGTSSGRGQAAPWCVQTWGVDGGIDKRHYPLDISDLQKAMEMPLQLYCPYFCPTTSYFDQYSNWTSVSSDTTLPGCKSYDFRNVAPEQSKRFYGWFLDKGIKAGMTSFESDFMNQNFNCVPDFFRSAVNGEVWLHGMADAAMERNVTIQWCYATPSDVLASLNMPAVTQFRVSFDFCYGQSWDIGESSLLVWALGAAPSKDTLWTTDNGKLITPGCDWTPDKESHAAELHLILALMSTGPVGISDLIGKTNVTLIHRAIQEDGVLLKPSKAITSVDSAFLDGYNADTSGYLYGTFALGPSWIFVSFNAKATVGVRLLDFWPQVFYSSERLLAFRHFDNTNDNDNNSCSIGSDAVSSNCIHGLVRLEDYKNTTYESQTLLSIEPSSALFSPKLTFVWQNCLESKWFLLGDLTKYVPLSPVRFKNLTCTSSGVSCQITGSPGEVVEVTALRPLRIQKDDYKVDVQKITIPPSEIATVVFSDFRSTVSMVG